MARKNELIQKVSRRNIFPVGLARNWIAQHLPSFFEGNRKKQDVLLGVRIIPNPNGNKVWEIEISFFRTKKCDGQIVTGTPFRGFLACHMRGNFTTYSLRFEDPESGNDELWFDQHETALSMLEHSVS